MNINLTKGQTAKLLLASFVLSAPIAKLIAFDNDVPSLVFDDTTKAPVLRDGKLVFKTKVGTEELVDPGEIYSLRSRVTALNGEAMTHRKGKETAEALLKRFEGLDPDQAREAFDKLSKIDQKKLIDAGEVDKVRESIKTTYDGEITNLKTENGTLKSRLNNMILGNAFSRSKFASERLNIPLDIAEATFGRNFTVNDDGKVTAKDASGNVIYSRKPDNSGVPADFEEAIEILINAYPNRDAILKGANNQGTGNKGGGGNNGAKNVISREAFEKLPASEQSAFAKGMRAGTHALSDN